MIPIEVAEKWGTAISSRSIAKAAGWSDEWPSQVHGNLANWKITWDISSCTSSTGLEATTFDCFWRVFEAPTAHLEIHFLMWVVYMIYYIDWQCIYTRHFLNIHILYMLSIVYLFDKCIIYTLCVAVSSFTWMIRIQLTPCSFLPFVGCMYGYV